MKSFKILIAAFCLAISGVAVFIWFGLYNVAANEPHWKITERFLSLVRERSITAHSKGIDVPLEEPMLLGIGFRNYHEMCRLCHHAPGYPKTEIAEGLYPAPLDLTSRERTKRSNAEVFWIVKNGIKMTGMAAFGSTHTEEELQGLVLFVQKLDGMTKEDYEAMRKKMGIRLGEGHHH